MVLVQNQHRCKVAQSRKREVTHPERRYHDGWQQGRMVVPDQLGRDGELRLEVLQRVWKVEVQVGVLPSLGQCPTLDRACLSRL